jgi:hypothetical protein
MIEGLKDGSSWFELDQQENDDRLNEESAVATFRVTQEIDFVRMVRLRQTGGTHWNDDFIVVSSFELFGWFIGEK